MDNYIKILAISLFCTLLIGIMPIWIGILLNVESTLITILLVLSLCISFPLGLYIAEKIADKLLD